MRPVEIGLERLLREAPACLAGRRVGLLCNAASVDSELRHVADRIALACPDSLVRLFGPEHGVRGMAQDMIGVGDAVDEETGVPVVSLYGDTLESLAPKPEQLADLDVLVCDLQDVGSRYYTYVWTVTLCLQICHSVGVELVLCDRPNPINGEDIEGGGISPGFESFVGLHNVPPRHGLTIGELVRLVAFERGLADGLTVISMEGWQREMDFRSTGCPWVQPSPNMASLQTAYVYPGMCLVEATALSEGRGTTRPFELVGAPGVRPGLLVKAVEERMLPGVRFRPVWFRPGFQKHAGKDCAGVQVHVTDTRVFRPYRTAVELLAAFRRVAPEAFAWRDQPYEFIREIPAIDLLTGSSRVREAIDEGLDLRDLRAEWDAESKSFRERRAPYLLYPRT